MLRYFISLIGLILLLPGCGSTPSTNPPTSGVVISTDHTTYTPSNAISFTVHNTLPTSIYAMHTLSSCSILSLQYQDNAVWQPNHVDPCPPQRPPRLATIHAGATQTPNN